MGVKARGKRLWGMGYVVWGEAQSKTKGVCYGVCGVGKSAERREKPFSFGLQGFQEIEAKRRSIHR